MTGAAIIGVKALVAIRKAFSPVMFELAEAEDPPARRSA
jgi:hypothetical protein